MTHEYHEPSDDVQMQQSVMDHDAIVLAGGGGRRLGGVDKASLVVGGQTLLERTLDAVSTAVQVVVVGDRVLPDHVVLQEYPAGGGPAAGIAAGVRALRDGAETVVVVASDMPVVATVVPMLLEQLAATSEIDGVLARDDGRLQYLACALRVGALRDLIAGRGTLHGASVRSLLSGLTMGEVEVPVGSTADIDTWNDLRKQEMP